MNIDLQSLFCAAVQNSPFLSDMVIPLFSIERNGKLKLVFDLPTG